MLFLGNNKESFEISLVVSFGENECHVQLIFLNNKQYIKLGDVASILQIVEVVDINVQTLLNVYPNGVLEF